VRAWQAAFPCVLLCWPSFPFSVCAFSGACTAVVLVVVLVDVGVVLVFGMAFVVVSGVGVVVGLVTVLLMVVKPCSDGIYND